ncbi:UNKNOWN [Stylonychia lemnae]|uniref:Uncharacterized protein n=1 Tax=Stylonychia lemnae TaxID=5949 RepID=A0A078AE97_STYLE|nr:UNKNOWN [Stylonychia lemnae]|eukprot:CDW79827.1 UNKNOWN [Stylonychia lemnae]
MAKQKLIILQNQVAQLHQSIAFSISDKIEYMHDYIIDITNNQELINRIEGVVAFRYSLNKFHLDHINDQEILKYFSKININDQMKIVEKNIKIKRDMFSEKNAKILMKLVQTKRPKNHEQRLCVFDDYDIWQEGKLSLESQSLYTIKSLKDESQEQAFSYEKFMECFMDIVDSNSYKSFKRFDQKESNEFVINFKERINQTSLSQRDMKLNYQNNLICELEQQLTIQETRNKDLEQQNHQHQQQLQQHQTLPNPPTFNVQNDNLEPMNIKEIEFELPSNLLMSPQNANVRNLNQDPMKTTSQDFLSLTSEKECLNTQKKRVPKLSKKPKKKIPSGLINNAKACCQDKLKKPKVSKRHSPIFLKKNSMQSGFSNISSSSDLLSYRRVLVVQDSSKKRKSDKEVQSNEKIKQQSLEITKLSQKVLEIESKMLNINNQQQQQPPKTIIIREPQVTVHQATPNIELKPSIVIPQQPNPTQAMNQEYFNLTQMRQQQYKDEIQTLYNINRNLLLSQRKYDYSVQPSHSLNQGGGLRLGSSAERYEISSHHQKCTSKFCLICKQ